jgi:ribosomal protein S4E
MLKNPTTLAAMAAIAAIGISLYACEEKEKASKPTEAAVQQETPEKLLVESISFNSAKKVYAINGKKAKIVGVWEESGAPKLELGETATVELSPNEIVKCDNYETTTIKKLYENHYLSEESQFQYYPMVFDVKDKSFGNYGN